MLKVVILVTNDIETDQRVARMAGSISSMGYAVTIVGRKLPSSKKKLDLIYSTFRFRLPINHGPLFYLSYNVWAFFFLLFRRFSVIVACDTDTLIAGRTIRLLKPSWLVFDAHDIASVPGISLVVPRLESFALASFRSKTKGIMVVGIDPPLENKLTNLSHHGDEDGAR